MIYTVYTDGSSRGNPGNAGWATIIMNQNKVREYSGFFERATNNQMEISAVLFALNFALKNLNKNDTDEDVINIFSDSEYTVKGCNEWVRGWSKKNWKNSQKKEVLNKDLWQKVLETMSQIEYKNIKFTINHVRGHNGHKYNERADRLCTAAATKEEIKVFSGDFEDYDDFIKL